MKRAILIIAGLVLAAGIAAPFLDAGYFRPSIERALERGLGRRVDIGEVRFNLFTGPGFTLDEVTIHEDPRAGIEPFAYMESLEASFRWIGLLKGRLEFSSLTLDDASINLVKTAAGPWNFQFLLAGAQTGAREMPAINMRSGRVNFKFGDTKSVFYFDDSDLRVEPSEGSTEIRFSGAPSRTDSSAQNFGHFFVRGTWSASRADLRVELERSSLEEVARLLDRRGLPVNAIVTLEAQLSGAPSNLDVTGGLRFEDIHRWDLLPNGGSWGVDFKGMLDLRGEKLAIQSVDLEPNPPLKLHFDAFDYLTNPHWDVAADVNEIPAATVVTAVRHLGVIFPDQMTAEGTVSGSVRYAEGWSGRLEMKNAALTLPDAQPIRAEAAVLDIASDGITLEPATVHAGDSETADLEGTYALVDPAGLDLKITTRGLSVAAMHDLGLAALPVIEHTPQGSWRGSARYHWSRGETGEWTGDYELQNARIAVPWLADPLRIQSAQVSVAGMRVSVSRMRGRAGEIAFKGDYRYEPGAVCPHHFQIVIPEAQVAELRRLCAPLLVRERGFLARTLRLGTTAAPDWLKAMRADGTVEVDSLAAGASHGRLDSARLLWDGVSLRLANVQAGIVDSPVSGLLTVDLAGASPSYTFQGKVQDIAYKGGDLDFEGTLEADGSDAAELVSTVHADGCLHGRAIAFAADTEFRTVSGCFEMLGSSSGPRWKFSGLEVTRGTETYFGTGTAQPDGRVILDLTAGRRQMRFTSTLFPPLFPAKAPE